MNMTDQKPTFRELAERAMLNQSDIMRASGLAGPTILRIMRQQPVRRLTLIQALAHINAMLGTTYKPEDVDAPTF